jgi:NDP-sugar pyrophosphorylase family protein
MGSDQRVPMGSGHGIWAAAKYFKSRDVVLVLQLTTVTNFRVLDDAVICSFTLNSHEI